MVPVLSISGGKDSAATALLVQEELGVECHRVFADTGWEADETYEYLDTLEKKLGKIDRVQSERGGFEEIAREKAGAPLLRGRWCTELLKLKPIAQYLRNLEEAEGETVSIVGIRAAESAARKKMPLWGDEAGGVLDCFVWRPILTWTIEDVLAIHHKHGLELNPLYHAGFDRVGCFPCIMSTKQDIRLVAEHDPSRIDRIERMETEWKEERIKRNQEKPGRYKREEATFFYSRSGHTTIRTVEKWSKTKHGGKKLHLIQPPPSGGCFRWGLCEPPTEQSNG